MKTKMGFRHKFAYSFYNFAAYKEFVIQGLGKAIFYSFLVTLIFSTITNIKTIEDFKSDISSVQADFVHSAPNFEFKDGILSMQYNEPLYYKYEDLMFIVDTTGKTSSSILDTYKDAIYINSNSITFKQEYRTIQTVDLANFNEWDITKDAVIDFLSVLQLVFPIVLLIVNPIVSFIVNLISIFAILAPFSLSISAFMGVKLNYAKASTVGAYAITLPLLMESLLNITGLDIPEFYIIFYLIGVVYCGLAIKEIKNTDKSNLNFNN